MRLNPTHPNIDYVIYMRGLTNMARMTARCKASSALIAPTAIRSTRAMPSMTSPNWCVVIRTASTPLTPINAWCS
nr:outer membrane biogenesis protein BamD [Klebsiella pneumoniae]